LSLFVSLLAAGLDVLMCRLAGSVQVAGRAVDGRQAGGGIGPGSKWKGNAMIRGGELMSTDKFFRMGAMAAVASSGFSILAAPAAIAGSLVPVLPDVVLMVLLLVADLFIFFALIGLYGVQAEKSGTTGLVGFTLAEIGLAVTPFLAPVGWLLFLVGLFALAAASSRAGVLPAGAMWLWFGGALVAVSAGLLGLGLLLAIGLLISAVGRAWLGMALWSGSLPSVRGQPSTGLGQWNR
jgi:hypothetical protein